MRNDNLSITVILKDVFMSETCNARRCPKRHKYIKIRIDTRCHVFSRYNVIIFIEHQRLFYKMMFMQHKHIWPILPFQLMIMHNTYRAYGRELSYTSISVLELDVIYTE